MYGRQFSKPERNSKHNEKNPYLYRSDSNIADRVWQKITARAAETDDGSPREQIYLSRGG
jgi:hypothetical protein